jgi:hypothetical protein
MTHPDNKKSLLVTLIGEQLHTVSFVQDYVELFFGFKKLTCYTWPHLIVEGKELLPEGAGYRDTLCAQIGRSVESARDISKVKLIVKLDSGVSLEISLRDEDMPSGEAATLFDDEGPWEVWN